LKKSNTLASADGKPLQELGKAIFDIQLGDLNFDIELIVEPGKYKGSLLNQIEHFQFH
jgi:hypothetical protein